MESRHPQLPPSHHDNWLLCRGFFFYGERDEQNNFLIHLFSFPLPQFQFLSAAHRKDVLNLWFTGKPWFPFLFLLFHILILSFFFFFLQLQARYEGFKLPWNVSVSIALRIPWTEEPGGLQSMGSQKVGHDWASNTFTFQLVGNSCLKMDSCQFW